MSRLVSSFMILFLPGLRQFDLGLYSGATSRLAVELEPPAEQGYPLTHAREADLLAATVSPRRPVRTKAASLVPDQEPDRASLAVEHYVDPGGLRVFADVRKGLLRDPEERRLYLLRQPPVAQCFLKVDLQAISLQCRDLKTDGGGQTEIVQYSGTEVVDHLPRLPD